MRIKTQFVICIVVFSAILLSIGALVITTGQQVAKLNAQAEISGGIERGASSLNSVAIDYFLYQEDLQLSRWDSSLSALSSDLSNLKPNSPQQQTLANNVADDLQRLNALFDDVVIYLQSTSRNVSVRIDPVFQVRWSSMAVQSQALAFDASQLSSSLNEQAHQSIDTSTLLIVSLVGVFGAFLATIYLVVFRRTLKSVAELQNGINTIGSGNLEYVIETKRQDEIAELSHSFNQMTANLKTVTASKTELEKENAERKKAEEELRKSEEEYSSLFANMMHGFAYCKMVFDEAGKPVDFVYIQINDAFETITGLKRDVVVGKKVTQAIPGIREANPELFEIYGRAALTRKKEKFEIFFKPLSLWLSISVYSPRKGYFAAVFEDITERKKAEETLRYHDLLVSSTSDAIFSTGNSFTIKSWNKAAERMFGWTAEEVAGKTSAIFNAVYPTLDGTTREQEAEQLLNNSFWKGEIIYHKKDGSPIPVSASASLVKDKNGTVVGMVAVVHDISAKKRREDVLRETQHDLNHAQAVAKTGSWRMDTQRNVLVWSDENHRIFGVQKGTPMTYESFLGIVHPEDREYVDRKWKAGLRGEPYDIEHRIVVNGEVKWVRERAELEFGRDGTLLGGFGTTQEITDLVKMRKKLEEYTNQMEDLAKERAEKLKDAERLAAIGATAGMVGHDIRNPLQSITGDLYLAKQDLISMPQSEEKESIRESLEAIEKSVDYVNKIVVDLQDFAKPLNPHMEETDLNSIVSDLLKNTLPNNIKPKVKIAKEAETLMTDTAYMKRILGNLITNAIQAMPEGGRLTINATAINGDTILTVQDTGVGIPEAAKTKLFQPLFTTKSKGQGFGLSVVKRMTEALNGTVTFESQQGKGTKFTIQLPKHAKPN